MDEFTIEEYRPRDQIEILEAALTVAQTELEQVREEREQRKVLVTAKGLGDAIVAMCRWCFYGQTGDPCNVDCPLLPHRPKNTVFAKDASHD